MHDFFYAVLIFISGIVAQKLSLAPSSVLLISLIGFLSLAWYFHYTDKFRIALLLFPLIFSMGFFLCLFQQHKQKKFQDLVQGKVLSVKGIVSSCEYIDNPRFKYRTLIDIFEIKITSRAPEQVSQTIGIYSQSKPTFLIQDTVEIEELSFKQSANQSFNNYLAKEKIGSTAYVQKIQYNLIKRASWNIKKALFYTRENLFYVLQNTIGKETFPLFSSIFLGARTPVKKRMEQNKESFKIWGISHYLARSGLHLVIFALVWHYILNLLPFAYFLKQIFLLLLIMLYAILTWESISFDRALLMYLLYRLCVLNRTPLHYVHLVTLATFLVLLWNPLQLLFLDFQLSFGLTFALAWFNHIEAHKKRIL